MSNNGTKDKNNTRKKSFWKFICVILPILLIATLALFIFTLKSIYPQTDETNIRSEVAKIVDKDPNDLTDDDFAKITKLDLYGKKCDIKLLEKFTNLQELDLGNLSVPKSNRPVWITKLAMHFHLNLHEKKFIDLSPIRKLTHLKKLVLFGGAFNDISSLSNLIHLEELNISATNISNIRALRNFVNLKVLYMFGTPVYDLDPLKNLNNLQILQMNSTQISSLEPLRKLRNLRILCIASPNIHNIEPIEDLKNLQELELQNTNIFNFEPLKKLTNLEKIELDSTQLSNLVLVSGLPKWEILYLLKPRVESLEYLKKITNVKNVILLNSENITDAQIENTKKAIPDIQISRVIG